MDEWTLIRTLQGNAKLNMTVDDRGESTDKYLDWTKLKVKMLINFTIRDDDDNVIETVYKPLWYVINRDDVEAYLNSDKSKEQKFGRYCWNSQLLYEELLIRFGQDTPVPDPDPYEGVDDIYLVVLDHYTWHDVIHTNDVEVSYYMPTSEVKPDPEPELEPEEVNSDAE